jgi:hypothetical protein
MDPRRATLNIITQPGDYTFPAVIEFNMPTTTELEEILAIEICRVKLIYVGKDVNCIQESVINNPMITKTNYIDR